MCLRRLAACGGSESCLLRGRGEEDDDRAGASWHAACRLAASDRLAKSRHLAANMRDLMGAQMGLRPGDERSRNPRPVARWWPLNPILSTWERHKDILRNALTLLATTGLTSGLGFAYWDVAAKLFTQNAVGYSDGAISVMTLLSWIGVFGLGTLLIGELPKRQGRDRGGLITAAVIASGVGSLAMTVLFILIVPRFTSSFNDITDSLPRAAVLCAAVALTAMTLVLDSATIGLLRGGLQLTRNFTFVIVKMITLFGAAFLLHRTAGIGIFMSWAAAIPVSLVPVACYLWRHGEFLIPRPDWDLLRSFGRSVMAHNWLNLAIQATPLLMPVIVASALGPSVTAGFFVAWTIISLFYIVPTHLSTVLFAVASGDPKALAPKLRFTLRVSVLVGLPGMAVLALGAHFILSLFGAGYARVAAVPMALLALGYLPSIPRFSYIAVRRAAGKMSQAAVILTLFSAVEIGAAVFATERDGAVGLAWALLIVQMIEAFYTLPAVVRAALVRGRHRRDVRAPSAAETVAPEATTQIGRHRVEADVRMRARQQAGLAVLMSMALPPPGSHLPLGEDEQVPAGRQHFG